MCESSISLSNIPNLHVFGAAEWKEHVDLKKHGLNVSDINEEMTKERFAFIRDKIASYNTFKNSGFVLLTIPQGLCVEGLYKIAQNPLKGKKTEFKVMKGWSDPVCFQDLPVQGSYQILLPSFVLEPGTKVTPDDHQPRLLEALANKVVHYFKNWNYHDGSNVMLTIPPNADFNIAKDGEPIEAPLYLGNACDLGFFITTENPIFFVTAQAVVFRFN